MKKIESINGKNVKDCTLEEKLDFIQIAADFQTDVMINEVYNNLKIVKRIFIDTDLFDDYDDLEYAIENVKMMCEAQREIFDYYKIAIHRDLSEEEIDKLIEIGSTL